MSIVVLSFTVYLIPGLWGAPLKLISGFPPPSFYKEWNKPGENPNHCPLNLNCFHDLDAGMEYAKAEGKPVLLDFTGWTCVNANSKNPKLTLTEFNHPPDLGNVFNHAGNIANNANGTANATENPSIPTSGPILLPPPAACTNNVPMMGPVQEKDTMARVKAMKNMPIKPPRSEALSALLAQEDGRVISKAPKNEIANVTNTPKKRRLD